MQTPPELVALRAPAAQDVLSACALLRAQWPFAHLAPRMPPVALLHQLYFLLGNRTHVDRELARLQQSGVLRVFRLFAHTEGHDLCVVRTADYADSLRALMPPAGDQEDGPAPGPAPPVGPQPQRSTTARLARPASLPVGSSSASAAAAAAAATASTAAPSPPMKSQSSSHPAAAASPAAPVFAPWPSSRPASTPSVAPPLPPPPSTTAAPPPLTPLTGAPPAASSARPVERQIIRRKRSLPTSSSSSAGASHSGAASVAASARSASAAAAIPISATANAKRAKVTGDISFPASSAAGAAAGPTGAPSAASAAAAAPSSSSSSSVAAASLGDPSGFGTLIGGTAGVNPKLHVNLSDTAVDERFPALAGEAASGLSPRDTRTLLRLFLAHLVPACSGVTVTQERLLELVYFPHVRSFTGLSSEQCVSALLRMHLIVFKSADSFYLTAPGVGRLLEALRCGRKELVALVKKRTYKEMPLRELMALPRLKTSPCRVEFHLREMLGSEQQLMLVDTAMGPLVRITQDK